MSSTGETIRVGLIGAGAFGRRLAHGVDAVDGLELGGIMDRDRQRVDEAAAILGAPAYASLDAILAVRDIVASLHASHHPIVTAAARAGKHLFVEKPLARRSGLAFDIATGVIEAQAGDGPVRRTAIEAAGRSIALGTAVDVGPLLDGTG